MSSGARGGPQDLVRCATCGYEISSYRSVPACPMCRRMTWEPAPWRPFTRRHTL